MNVTLDDDGRFVLIPTPPGFQLEVDGKVVHYCRKPSDAINYIIEESLAESLDTDVVKKLEDIESIVSDAWQNMSLILFTKTIAKVTKHVENGKIKRAVKIASLEMSGCKNTSELKSRPDCDAIVKRARIIVKTLEGIVNESGKRKGSGTSEAEDLDQAAA